MQQATRYRFVNNKIEPRDHFIVIEYPADTLDVIDLHHLVGGNPENDKRTTFFGPRRPIEEKFRFALRERSYSQPEAPALVESEPIPNRILERIRQLKDDYIAEDFFKDVTGVNPNLLAFMGRVNPNFRQSEKVSRQIGEELLAAENMTTYKRAALSLGVNKASFLRLLHAIERNKPISRYSDEHEVVDQRVVRDIEQIQIPGKLFSRRTDKLIELQEHLSQQYGIELSPEYCYIEQTLTGDSKKVLAQRYDIFLNSNIGIPNAIRVKNANAAHLPNDYTSKLMYFLFPDTLKSHLWTAMEPGNLEFPVSQW